MPFTEDFTSFFNVDEFAHQATYDGATLVNGIFDADYLQAIDLVDGSGPQFLCALADVPNVAQGKPLVVAGVTYTIRGVEQDGTGLVRLRLER